MTLYKNKYRIESTRLSKYDYTNCGFYYITICTKNKTPFLGQVINEKVLLSESGEITRKIWLEIPNHYKNIKLDKFIIMPNHIHGIIIIEYLNNIETCHGMSLQKNQIKLKTGKFASPISGSLSMIINQFKSSVTRTCRKQGFISFEWQPGFYEHIIRSENS